MANEVVLDCTKPPDNDNDNKAVTCICCRVERVPVKTNDVTVSTKVEDGFCWLCKRCLAGVKDYVYVRDSGNVGGEGSVADADGAPGFQRGEEEVANRVLEELDKRVDAIVDRIAEKIELNRTGDLNGCTLAAGERSLPLGDRSFALGERSFVSGDRSFAEVVKRPSAKILIKNAGDSVAKQASEVLKQTPVSFMKTEKDGTVMIALPDQSMLAEAETQLKAALPDVASIKSSIRLPKVTVKDFPLPLEDFPIDMERKDLDAAIVDLIRMKNRGVRDLIDSGHTFEVVFVGKSRDRGRANVGLRVSCGVRDHLVSSGRLYVMNVACKVEDRYHIPQCYCCQRFGHKSWECDQNQPTCKFCAEHHETRYCQNKRNLCCVNCRNSNDPKVRQRAATHNAGSADCPVFLLKLKLQQSKN